MIVSRAFPAPRNSICSGCGGHVERGSLVRRTSALLVYHDMCTPARPVRRRDGEKPSPIKVIKGEK